MLPRCVKRNFKDSTIRHLQDFAKTFQECFNYLSKFYWGGSTSFLKKLSFSGLLMKKWDQKVGHVYRFISCTGLDYTGKSLFSNALGGVISDLSIAGLNPVTSHI